MKDIVTFLLESRGADIRDRKNSRFFGDDLSKPRSIKNEQTRTKKFLKDNESKIDKDVYDFAVKLATNQQGNYDSRSHINIFVDKYDDFTIYNCDMYIHCDAMSKAIENKLSLASISRKFNIKDNSKKTFSISTNSIYDKDIKYVISSSDFGDTARLDLSLGTRGKTPNEKLFFDMFNFILITLSDFKEEILNYYEDYKDKDVIKDRS